MKLAVHCAPCVNSCTPGWTGAPAGAQACAPAGASASAAAAATMSLRVLDMASRTCPDVSGSKPRKLGDRASGADGVVRRHRAPEEEALAELAAQRAQQLQLLGGLDALGDHLHAQRAAKLEDHAQEGRLLRAPRGALDERARDLEHVEGQRAQIA